MTSPITPLSVAEAQHYLHLVQTVPAKRIGPHRMFRDPVADAAPVKGLAARLVASIERRDDRTYYAPSAWHAAAWLLDVAALIGQVANVDGDSGLNAPYAPQHGAPVFRGQRHATLPLLPTLQRSSATAADANALELLVDAMREMFSAVHDPISANRQVLLAALQHYGMPTPLLDFTADPHVAVFFACKGGPAEPSASACVYGLPLGLFAQLGGSVVFPPPWAKRLYAQRGVFVESPAVSPGLDLREACFRVLFPPDPAFALSASRIDEGALLPDESWFASAIAWARRSAGRPLGGTASTSLIEACGKPPFFLDSIRPGLHPDRLDTFADLFDWLALKKFQGAMVHDTGTIELMAQHNMRLFRSFSATMKLVANQLFPDPATRRKAAEAFPWFAAFTAIDSYLATVDGTSAQREVKQNVTSYRRILLWWTIATTLLVVCAVGAGLAVGFIDGTALGRFFGSVLPR